MIAEMYPSTDYPTYKESFETLQELCDAVERIDEGLNHIVSWIIGCRECSLVEYSVTGDQSEALMWEDGEKNYFTVLIFMPRKSQTTEFTVEFDGSFPHLDVDNWLEGYVKQRICRWYGWTWDIKSIK